MQHVAVAFRQPGGGRVHQLMLGGVQHLHGPGGQAVGSLQQGGIAVEIVAVDDQRQAGMAQAVQHGGSVRVTLVGHLEHGKQFAGDGIYHCSDNCKWSFSAWSME